MSFKTIAGWQQRSEKDQTRILKSVGTFNCGHCSQQHRSTNSIEHTMVVCSSCGSVDFFCSGCWDSEEWMCPDCQQVPAPPAPGVPPPPHVNPPPAPSAMSKTNPTLKSKKKKSKKKKRVVKRFPFGIEQGLKASFDDFFEESCCISSTNISPSASGLLMVGDVHKEYRAWCTKNERVYCSERTSKRWEIAPFVVNETKIDRLPPFRLLMFQKLGRMPMGAKAVFSSTETSWRRHKKTYAGHPFYQGLKWKDSFTPSIKYIKKKSL